MAHCLLKYRVSFIGDSSKVRCTLAGGKLVRIHHEEFAITVPVGRDSKMQRDQRSVCPFQETCWHSIALLQEIQFRFTFPTTYEAGRLNTKILRKTVFLLQPL